MTVSVSKTATHSCSVGGSLTLGGSVEAAGTALFYNCKATAQAQVEINAQLSGSYTETVSIESSTVVPPFKVKSYKFEKLRKDSSGNIDTYDHKITCRHIPTGWTSDKNNYCNATTLSGRATGWGATRAKWTEDDLLPNGKELEQ